MKNYFNPHIRNLLRKSSLILILSLLSLAVSASDGRNMVAGTIRIEFIIFGLVLTGIVFFHKHTFKIAVLGVLSLILFKLIFDTNFNLAVHFFGTNSFASQVLDKTLRQGEWGIILNLAGLLPGFAILAKVFEKSRVPEILPNYLPDDWGGPFMLLVFVFIFSSFLDNIAAAIIGATIAFVVFKNKVHIGYLAAIVAASNAGGCGSVIGDTTTTMMWIDGVSQFNVLHGYIGAVFALLFFGWFASHQQDRYQRIQKDATPGIKADYGRLIIVLTILTGALISNFLFDLPALGVWIAILIGAIFRPVPWKEVSGSLKGTIFLLSLVISASLMPVEDLPEASWISAFVLGFVSAVFDNIPLTKLCLTQGHYDWGMLAYTVGFGGSMIWFGSSAGVAVSNKFPEASNIGRWLKDGWHVTVAYIIGFFALYLIMGWEPADNKEHKIINCPVPGCPMANKQEVSIPKSPVSSLNFTRQDEFKE